MSFKFFWKVWLRLNPLTKDVDNDYIAEVSTINNTQHNEDIARCIVELGSEIKYDTLLSVLNQHDRIVREMVQQGSSVLTGVCQFTPRVLGPWIGGNAKFDPSVHKVTLDIVPSAEMRQALTEVGVEVLGVKDSGAYIGLVIDKTTGAIDDKIAPGDDICIKGYKLKVLPNDDANVGVFFVNAAGTAVQASQRLIQNDPKVLIARVPTLPAGQYTLRVVTRYSTSSRLLKTPRKIDYERLLTVS
jgi:hypothetical protein